MSTPARVEKNVSNATKIDQGSIHKSNSKAVENYVKDLDGIIKSRREELSKLQGSTAKKISGNVKPQSSTPETFHDKTALFAAFEEGKGSGSPDTPLSSSLPEAIDRQQGNDLTQEQVQVHADESVTSTVQHTTANTITSKAIIVSHCNEAQPNDAIAKTLNFDSAAHQHRESESSGAASPPSLADAVNLTIAEQSAVGTDRSIEGNETGNRIDENVVNLDPEAVADRLQKDQYEKDQQQYIDTLRHQLKVVNAKNAVLQKKVDDIDDLMQRNYGSIHERSKSLTVERNRLERQRAQLEEELLSTQEELHFIRAQLQSKSARISELEMELLTAQRAAGGGGSEEEEELSGSRSGSDHGVSSSSMPVPGAGTASQEEKAADSSTPGRYTKEREGGEEEDTSRIAVSAGVTAGGGMMSSSVSQISAQSADDDDDAADNADGAAGFAGSSGLSEAEYSEAVSENLLLAQHLENSEKESVELVAQILDLERRLAASEEEAFQFEARAAALENELLKKTENESDPTQDGARKELAEAALPSSSSSSSTSSARHLLPLRQRPLATPRIPREGYVLLLLLVAFLQIVIWVLVLVIGLLYLGILEQRYGVDILRDGGVSDPSFLLKGVRMLIPTAPIVNFPAWR
mmetsp:Transcript_12497/g.20919  ORF Transcript_12497/g.20919 Transcript_12497/m.20919 type:complete len:636 (-) Transcript_12497:891-2798(-)